MERKLILDLLTVLVFVHFSLLLITTCKASKTDIETVKVKNEFDRNWEKYKIRENLTTRNLIEEMGIGINMGNTLVVYIWR